ncbi:hypothetical protein EVAR_58034_1 [Eumeta japonica]|uniref:Ig-like domain-containing protein n=1 Tax=Eumeta variegata TaxID=151549 RepID=A0A4C1ZL65_EUMVA|nr:hypothetical protein EVAR_58034_1 [Eumeta japonica]
MEGVAHRNSHLLDERTAEVVTSHSYSLRVWYHIFRAGTHREDSLSVNQRPEVWEGSEFILSCVAFGSPSTTFTWYKDGVKVNFNGTNSEEILSSPIKRIKPSGRPERVAGRSTQRKEKQQFPAAYRIHSLKKKTSLLLETNVSK